MKKYLMLSVLALILAMSFLGCKSPLEDGGTVYTLDKKHAAPASVFVSTYTVGTDNWAVRWNVVPDTLEYRLYIKDSYGRIIWLDSITFTSGTLDGVPYYEGYVAKTVIAALNNFLITDTTRCFGVCAIGYDLQYSDITWSMRISI